MWYCAVWCCSVHVQCHAITTPCSTIRIGVSSYYYYYNNNPTSSVPVTVTCGCSALCPLRACNCCTSSDDPFAPGISVLGFGILGIGIPDIRIPSVLWRYPQSLAISVMLA